MQSEPLAVQFWEIGSPNAARSREFYRAVCGWTFEDPDEIGYSPAKCGADGIPGGLLDTNGGSPFAMIYVRVSNLEAAIHRALDSGGALITAATQVPETDAWFAVVRDPDGNRLGFFWRPDAA